MRRGDIPLGDNNPCYPVHNLDKVPPIGYTWNMTEWMTATHTPNSTCACSAPALMTFQRYDQVLPLCTHHALAALASIADRARMKAL